MEDRIDEVTIVGGGDSGLLTALAIRQLNPAIDVSVVDDFQRGVPQVGKSTFKRIFGILHDVLEVDRERFTREVRPVWKCSVFFRDWCGREPFHYPFDVDEKFPDLHDADAIQQYYHLYEEAHADDLTVNEAIVAANQSPLYFQPRASGYNLYGPVAYHLDTNRFNEFLRGLCAERGVSLIDDEIVAADVANGTVERVRSESQHYAADLYVDATGFNRVLVGDLDREFRDFDLPLDTAYNVRVERPLSEVIPATVVESGDSGWFWHIDTYDDRDYGYVYASEFVSDDDAVTEFLEHVREDIDTIDGDVDDVAAEDVATYEFTSGYYEESWADNLLAIGNAGGFVEPLESTGLTYNADAAVQLSLLLSAHGRIADDGIREAYNEWWRRGWESIYDFIAVHYKFAPGDTPFWERMREMDVSPRVDRLVREFDRNGYDVNVPAPTENGTDVEPLQIFRPIDFYAFMRNVGCTSEFYETNEFHVSDDVKRRFEQTRAQLRERVEGNHITTQEFYQGVLPQY